MGKNKNKIGEDWVRVPPPYTVKPKTRNQDYLMRSISEKTLTVALGPAGTGKTYCAGMVAARLLLDAEIHNLVLTRANVPTGKSLGHFPGTIEEKMAPWLAPMINVLAEGLGRHYVAENLNETIFMQPIETIRGQSFADSIILVDEAQNLSLEEIKAITTRIGQNSKLVLMGDPAQSDVKKGMDLLKFAEMCHEHNIDVPVVEFTVSDIVRSDIVGDLVRMFHEM